LANAVVGATFLTMLNTVGHAPTFLIYAAMTAGFIVLTLFFVPETRGVPLERIEQNLMEGKRLPETGR
jgi:SP family galactose:H+ symporter-like MFS transporter